MEDALSDAKLDLRVSTRKEQQTESVSSSLRERNRDLREKLKAAEEMVSNKTKAEDDLKEQLKALESELERGRSQIDRAEKSHQVSFKHTTYLKYLPSKRLPAYLLIIEHPIEDNKKKISPLPCL